MKKFRIIIVVMLIAGLSGFAQLAQAKDTADVNKPAKRGWRGRGSHRPEMTAARFERMLERLAKKDPERAEELRKLREEDPKQFRKKVREIRMNWMLERLERHNPERAEELRKLREDDPEQFRKEIREHLRRNFAGRRGAEFRGPKGFEGPRPKGAGPKGPAEHGAMRFRRPPRRPKHVPEEFVEWLKENYPEDANELAEIKERHPGRYGDKLGLHMRKWGHIYRAWHCSPELAEVLKEDMQLRRERNEILEEYQAAGEQEKEALKSQLQEVVSKRFELIVKRKERKPSELEGPGFQEAERREAVGKTHFG